MDTGSKIRKLRTANSLSQENLAEILGVDRSTISAYETNKRSLTIHRAQQLTHIFHVKLQYFTDDSETDEDKYEFYVKNIDKQTYKRLINLINQKRFSQE